MGTKKLFNLRFFIPNPFYFGKCVKITKTLETCYEANYLLLHTRSHFFLQSLRLKVNSMLVRSNHLKLLIRILPRLSTLFIACRTQHIFKPILEGCIFFTKRIINLIYNLFYLTSVDLKKPVTTIDWGTFDKFDAYGPKENLRSLDAHFWTWTLLVSYFWISNI